MAKPQPRPKKAAAPKASTRPPRHTVPVEEHPGFKDDGVPQRTANGPRPEDLKLKQPGQDPALDFSKVTAPEHGVLGADEEV